MNTYYKRVRVALELDKHDVAEILRLGGGEASLSEIEGWSRRESDQRRYRSMSEAQFDVFTRGLVEWARDNLD